MAFRIFDNEQKRNLRELKILLETFLEAKKVYESVSLKQVLFFDQNDPYNSIRQLESKIVSRKQDVTTVRLVGGT